MDTLQLAPLSIGSSVLVRTTSKAKCEGTYKGYLEEKHSIWLNDAKWYDADAGASGNRASSNYDSLILPLDSIAYIEGIQRVATVADVSANIADVDVKIADVDATVVDVDAIVVDFDATVVDVNAKIADVDATVVDVEAKVADVEAKVIDVDAIVADVDATLADVDATVAVGDATVVDVDATLADDDAKIADVVATVADVDATVVNTASSLVKVSSIQIPESTSASSKAFNGFTAQKLQSKGHTETTHTTKMQEFCKQLFSSCNFAQLLQRQAKKNETKFYIKLPSYYANLFRQPKWCFETTQPPAVTNTDRENQSVAIIKPDMAAAIDISLMKNFDDAEIAASVPEPVNPNQIEDSKYVNLNLCAKLRQLNLNGSFDKAAAEDFEAIEVDLSDKTLAQIKIGNLLLKTSTQLKD